ncbi:anaerobic benzoate catabolism transcriptional regulator [compost metagenome]
MEQDSLKRLGERAKELRLSKGLTQLEVADKFGSAESTISRLEKGKYNPSYLWLTKFCKALEIDLKELF